MEKLRKSQLLICILFAVSGIIAALYLLTDNAKPEYYNLLFLLPLTFSFASLLCQNVYAYIPGNLGVTFLILLLFCRMVISPLFMCLGEYNSTIHIELAQNTNTAIFLVCYEAVAIFILLMCKKMRKTDSGINLTESEFIFDKSQKNKYTFVLLVMLAAILVCYVITPEFTEIFRTIFDISDEHFANYEAGYIVKKYSSGTLTTLTLLAGYYMTNAAIIIIPAYLIVLLAKNSNKKIAKFISLLICFVPLFFIGGVIGASLIYIVCLLILRDYMFNRSNNKSSIFKILILGSIGVISWWTYRTLFFGGDSNMYVELSGKFSSYFSGVNIVSGVFNLPEWIGYKLRYIAYDYLKSIPSLTTILGLKGIDIQSFFNLHNATQGQIPPTIGMSCYYFGLPFAPIYSLIFANIACNAGEKIEITKNPFSKIRLILTSLYFAMGIVMYNIPITMNNFFMLLFPMYIMETYAKRSKNQSDSEAGL